MVQQTISGLRCFGSRHIGRTRAAVQMSMLLLLPLTVDGLKPEQMTSVAVLVALEQGRIVNFHVSNERRREDHAMVQISFL